MWGVRHKWLLYYNKCESCTAYSTKSSKVLGEKNQSFNFQSHGRLWEMEVCFLSSFLFHNVRCSESLGKKRIGFSNWVLMHFERTDWLTHRTGFFFSPYPFPWFTCSISRSPPSILRFFSPRFWLGARRILPIFFLPRNPGSRALELHLEPQESSLLSPLNFLQTFQLRGSDFCCTRRGDEMTSLSESRNASTFAVSSPKNSSEISMLFPSRQICLCGIVVSAVPYPFEMFSFEKPREKLFAWMQQVLRSKLFFHRSWNVETFQRGKRGKKMGRIFSIFPPFQSQIWDTVSFGFSLSSAPFPCIFWGFFCI